jgi:hypothetical protein
MVNESAAKARYRDGLFGFIGKRPFVAMLKTFYCRTGTAASSKEALSNDLRSSLGFTDLSKRAAFICVVGVRALGYLI